MRTGDKLELGIWMGREELLRVLLWHTDIQPLSFEREKIFMFAWESKRG